MTIDVKVLHKDVEEAMMPEVVQLLQPLVCKLLKSGVELPNSDVLFKILAGLYPDPDKKSELSLGEGSIVFNVTLGVNLLAQLSLTKERM
jgi:hypothetical protein